MLRVSPCSSTSVCRSSSESGPCSSRKPVAAEAKALVRRPVWAASGQALPWSSTIHRSALTARPLPVAVAADCPHGRLPRQDRPVEAQHGRTAASATPGRSAPTAPSRTPGRQGRATTSAAASSGERPTRRSSSPVRTAVSIARHHSTGVCRDRVVVRQRADRPSRFSESAGVAEVRSPTGEMRMSDPLSALRAVRRVPRPTQCAAGAPPDRVRQPTAPSWSGCRCRPRRRRTTPGSAATQPAVPPRCEVGSARRDLRGDGGHLGVIAPLPRRPRPARPPSICGSPSSGREPCSHRTPRAARPRHSSPEVAQCCSYRYPTAQRRSVCARRLQRPELGVPRPPAVPPRRQVVRGSGTCKG